MAKDRLSHDAKKKLMAFIRPADRDEQEAHFDFITETLPHDYLLRPIGTDNEAREKQAREQFWVSRGDENMFKAGPALYHNRRLRRKLPDLWQKLIDISECGGVVEPKQREAFFPACQIANDLQVSCLRAWQKDESKETNPFASASRIRKERKILNQFIDLLMAIYWDLEIPQELYPADDKPPTAAEQPPTKPSGIIRLNVGKWKKDPTDEPPPSRSR